MHLNFPNRIPEADILGRLLGPDACGGFVQAVRVEHHDAGTRVHCRPVSPDETATMTQDRWGQWWLPISADHYPGDPE